MSGADDESTPKGPEEEPEEFLPLDDLVDEPLDADSFADLLGDRYTPVARIGEGTFGEVIRARDRVLGREVAVKRVRLEAFGAPSQLEEVKVRFLREAQVVARLRHPNIVAIHDIISTPRSSCIVMELVEGQDLQSRLQERGRLGLDETLDALLQVAAALDHAHASGIVHRDIKPANIMIERSGRVKVMDFGIAKVEQGGSRTSTGLIMGTPNYMSPEQARGWKVDGRADVFSLGCVLYECVSGKKPFHDESVTAILLKVVAEPPPQIDFEALGLPRALDGVLGKAMAKEPGQRFASAGGLMEAARLAAHTRVPESPHPGTPAPWVSRALSRLGGPGRGLSRALAALAVLIVVGGILGLFAVRTPDADDSRPVSPGGRLVVEEDLGFLARLFGREPRLLITVPGTTRVSLEMQTPISSATARPGDSIMAGVVEPIVIEGQEAIAAGARVRGRVADVESAEEAGGLGRLTLDFDAVDVTGGARVRIESDPVELVAPRPRPAKSRRKGLAGAWDKVTSTVDDIVRDVKGEGAGVTGAHAVQVGAGVDIEVPAGSTLRIRLARAVTITRARTP